MLNICERLVHTKRSRINHLKAWDTSHLDLATPEFVTEKLDAMELSGASRMHTNHLLKEVKCLFSYALQLGAIKGNPITGTFKDFDVTGQPLYLHEPTPFMAGEYDEAAPSTVRHYQSLVPGAEMIVIPGSGHFTLNDNPAENIKGIRNFLNKWNN